MKGSIKHHHHHHHKEENVGWKCLIDYESIVYRFWVILMGFLQSILALNNANILSSQFIVLHDEIIYKLNLALIIGCSLDVIFNIVNQKMVGDNKLITLRKSSMVYFKSINFIIDITNLFGLYYVGEKFDMRSNYIESLKTLKTENSIDKVFKLFRPNENDVFLLQILLTPKCF